MEIVKEYENKVKEAGYPVLQGSSYCKDRLENHENPCKSCEGRHGCSRVRKMLELKSVGQMLIMTAPNEKLRDMMAERVEIDINEVIKEGVLPEDFEIVVKDGDKI